MLRIILEPIGLFLLPFFAYFIYRFLKPLSEDEARHKATFPVLGAIGVALAMASILLVGLTVKHPGGTYHPAIIKDGQIERGQLQ